MSFKLFLTLDCEDFVNKRSTNALYHILILLRKYNLKAIFFLTGHQCERLCNTPKILDLLQEHEIGYHSSSHSVHPNIFEYTDIESYDAALAISLQRETMRINPLSGKCEGKGGIELLKDCLPNNKIVSFRAPGFCWSPPHLEALQKLGIQFDFSTNISLAPIRYRKITFYPYPRWGYGFTPLVRSLFSSVLTFRQKVLHERSQYGILMFHPDNVVNKNVWDCIYYGGNPRRLDEVPPRSLKEIERILRSYELFLRRISSLASKGVLEVTPPLTEGKTKPRFTEADALRSYRRSIEWPEKFFNYKPRFLLRHFYKYFNVESAQRSI
jgi:hypothetical protein